MKMKKLLAASLCAILMTISLAACTSAGTSSDSASPSSASAGSDTDFGNLESFACTTFDGTDFTQADCAGYDLTIVNFWMTTCPPCINELPDLEELRAELPENVQIVLVCLDADTSEQDARKLIEESGFKGTVLFPGSGDMDTLSQQVVYVPTTLFFDSEGNRVGASLVGSPSDVVSTYVDQVDAILGDMGKEIKWK